MVPYFRDIDQRCQCGLLFDPWQRPIVLEQCHSECFGSVNVRVLHPLTQPAPFQPLRNRNRDQKAKLCAAQCAPPPVPRTAWHRLVHPADKGRETQEPSQECRTEASMAQVPWWGVV